MKEFSLAELADRVCGKVSGDGDVRIRGAATLENAGAGEITFLTNRKYANHVKESKAGAIVVGKELDAPCPLIISEDPYFAFREIVVLLHGHRIHPGAGISERSSVAKSAVIGEGCYVGDFVSISEDAKIGARCVLYPGVFVGPGTEVGDDCILYPSVTVYENCRIGRRVIIQANAAVGQDGFGFATHKGEHFKIPHIGRVIVEDDVELGSCCVIERGTLDDTVIGKGSKVGDNVAIGHGTKVGAYCLLVPQVGISGSTTLGHHVVAGGQVGIAGHLHIGNCVMIGAQAGVINDVEDGRVILGAPAMDAGKAKRAYSLIEYLPEMKRKIKRLEQMVEKLGGESGVGKGLETSADE